MESAAIEDSLVVSVSLSSSAMISSPSIIVVVVVSSSVGFCVGLVVVGDADVGTAVVGAAVLGTCVGEGVGCNVGTSVVGE